jgi:pyruvate kinase
MTDHTSAAGDVWAQPGPAKGLAGATAAVAALRADLIARSTYPTLDLASVHATHRQDAENLLQYLELRHRDMRELQARLADLGLSSLGRSEGHVLATVDAVLRALRALADSEERPATAGSDASSKIVPSTSADAEDGVTFATGRGLLASNTEALLGPSRVARETRIMVTLPGSAADDYPLIRTLVERGMDCARINCAHDDATAWAKMIEHIRLASRETGRPCSVAMDLAGPKLRTGPVAPGPAVARLRPQRDAYGRVTAAAACWLVGADSSSARPEEIPHQGTDGLPTPPQPATSTPVEPPPGLRVSVPPAFIAALRVGDQIRLRDTRGARRRLRVTAVASSGARVEADQTTYLAAGMPLHVRRGRGRGVLSTHVGELPPVEQSLRLRVGDRLLLTRDLAPAEPPKPDETAHLGCTLPEVFGQVAPGHRVWFDDGKIGAIVIAARPTELELRITDAPPAGARLRAGKGINLPDTDLPVSALTAKDKDDLGFVAAHADIVSLSFVRRPADVQALHDALVGAGREDIGVILKIETLRAFENLPQLLLAALHDRRVGVMIARGDLAVECGYERLAELQEEILWLCEAAHVPVIWATQVLDQLARTGRPTRAEITDAAMAGRAECVMLNKGPYITDAVALLDDVLTRMSDRQRKNVPLLDELRWTADAGETVAT